MATRNDIEIGFDEDSGGYYAIWRPPIAIGLGKSMTEALRDVREAVEFCIDCHIQRKLRKVT